MGRGAEREHHDWHDTGYVEAWISEHIDGDADHRARVHRLAELVAASVSADRPLVLDLGTGPGVLAAAILRVLPSAHVVCQDFSTAMLDRARDELAWTAGRASFHHSDLASPDWHVGLEQPFDAVVSSYAIHNLRSTARIRALYEGAAGRLAPGGCMFLLDLVESPGPRTDVLYGRRRREDDEDVATLDSQPRLAHRVRPHGGRLPVEGRIRSGDLRLPPMIHLDDATVAEVLDLPGTTDALESALRDLAAGDAATTLRVRAAVGDRMASAMAAVIPAAGVSGGKMYATYPGGFSFVVALFATDGGVLCTFDGDMLTRIRTAAATAVALRHLARPATRVATLLGTGHQSQWQVRALCQELDLVDLRIWGRSAERAEELAAWARTQGIPARALDDSGAAVAGAGAVVAVTSAYTPIFSGERLAEDVLVCGVGSTKADRRELDGRTVERAAMIVTDSCAGAVTECGDLTQAAAEGLVDLDSLVELADVVAGAVDVPHSGVVLFESQGIALEDVAAAGLAYQRWTQR